MSKVQYFNHKTMRALFMETSGIGKFIRRECDSGVLVLRDCVRERGKNQSKKITKSYHANFTFDEISDRLKDEIPNNDGNFIIGSEQAVAPSLKASFPTLSERDEWLKSTFKVVEEYET